MEYISLQSATNYCPYSQEYLSLRARQGKLKSVKFGRKWMTTREWLEDYLGEFGRSDAGTSLVAEVPQVLQNVRQPVVRDNFLRVRNVVHIPERYPQAAADVDLPHDSDDEPGHRFFVGKVFGFLAVLASGALALFFGVIIFSSFNPLGHLAAIGNSNFFADLSASGNIGRYLSADAENAWNNLGKMIEINKNCSGSALASSGGCTATTSDGLVSSGVIIVSDGQKTFTLNGSGQVRTDGGVSSSMLGTGEYVNVQGEISNYQAGDLLEISTQGAGMFTKSSVPYSSTLVGVVVQNAAFVFGDTAASGDVNIQNKVIMGLSGQVIAKVTTTNGAIEIGDAITSSDIPGVGMKATSGGRVIGIALAPYSGDAISEIPILLSVGWQSGTDSSH